MFFYYRHASFCCQGLVLYKLERMEESLDTFRWIVDCARDKDEPQGMISDIGIPKVCF